MKAYDVNNQQPGWQPDRSELGDWLRSQVLCSLATLDTNGQPEVATVAFSETDQGDFIVGTSQSSRKSQNIDGDSRVAMVVTDPSDRYTAQIKGTAQKLSDVAFAALADTHYKQRPESLPFKDDPSQTHILVSPEEVRFSDCSVSPWLTTTFDGQSARIEQTEANIRSDS